MSDSLFRFAERPSAEYVEAWRQFLEDTGEPEKYDLVSNDKPDRNANVVLLSGDLVVPIGRRPDAALVPCPLCSASSPKFGKGRMAWFPDDGKVRFIGHTCAKRYLGENYAEAERRFRSESRCLRYQRIWPLLFAMVSEIEDIAEGIIYVGERLGGVRRYVDRKAPGFCTFLHRDRAYKGNGVATSTGFSAKTTEIAGLEMLREGFAPDEEAKAFSDLGALIRPGLPHWQQAHGENAVAKEILIKGRKVEGLLKTMLEMRDEFEAAGQFFQRQNLDLIRRWFLTGQSPYSRFDLEWKGETVTIDAESFAGAYQFEMLTKPDITAALPTREQILSLNFAEILD